MLKHTTQKLIEEFGKVYPLEYDGFVSTLSNKTMFSVDSPEVHIAEEDEIVRQFMRFVSSKLVIECLKVRRLPHVVLEHNQREDASEEQRTELTNEEIVDLNYRLHCFFTVLLQNPSFRFEFKPSKYLWFVQWITGTCLSSLLEIMVQVTPEFYYGPNINMLPTLFSQAYSKIAECPEMLDCIKKLFIDPTLQNPDGINCPNYRFTEVKKLQELQQESISRAHPRSRSSNQRPSTAKSFMDHFRSNKIAPM